MPEYLRSIARLMRRTYPNADVATPARAILDRKRPVDWAVRGLSPAREYLEAMAAIAAVTVAGWFAPFGYRAFGHVYLLAVILLCLRVGRGPVLIAAIVSAVAWNYVIMPPRMSFSVLDFEDGMILGTYIVVALIAGQLTARIRAQERDERQREQRATALFHLTRALSGAHTLDEAVQAALRQADELFTARTALLLIRDNAAPVRHPASSLVLNAREQAVADWVGRHGREAGRCTTQLEQAEALHLPLTRASQVRGVLVLLLPAAASIPTPEQRELLEAFAAQIALLIEREQLRAASEREKLLAESDRLHRTLLDSVSHELKTPLAVLRSAAENLHKEGEIRRTSLAGEILTATRRLDRVVANLLDQTRLESGAVKPQLDWCDVRDLIGAARRGLGDTLAGRPIRIEIPADTPLVLADAPLMEQVIINLLHNAVLYTPAGSQLTLTAGVDESKHQVFLTVADHGPGVPARLKGQLFQKFRRGGESPASGLGLGLSIVRGFMLAQGGDVVADDNPGKGARFTVYLPHALHGCVPNE